MQFILLIIVTSSFSPVVIEPIYFQSKEKCEIVIEQVKTDLNIRGRDRSVLATCLQTQ